MEKVVSCPHCNSSDLRKEGTSKSGAKKYLCKACRKYFSIREKVYSGLTCPSCKSKRVVKGGKLRNGTQRYQCQDCKYRFVENPQQREYDRHEVKCPLCHHPISVKAGKSSKGEQYYKCKQCKHKFLEKQKYRNATPKDKDLMVMYNLNLGVSKKQLSQYLGFSPKSVYNIIKKFKEEHGIGSNEVK